MAICTTAFAMGLLCGGVIMAGEEARVVENVIVYKEPGRFGGWPANWGIWSWGEEILVGISIGYHKDLGPDRHAIDRERPEQHVFARSLDGGRTWKIEDPAKEGVIIPAPGAVHGVVPPGLKEPEWLDCPGGIDFTHPDFAMTIRMTGIDCGPSRFYVSTDRGHTWRGPYKLPLFGQPGIMARTDYIVNGRHDCMLFLTASKKNRQEGRPCCVRTTDGGKSWRFVSWICPEPTGFAIMPSTVRLDENRLITAVRRREGPKRWIETHHSGDNGRSWAPLNIPVPNAGEGNPASMIKLADGRICFTYGHRAKPYGIQARLSSDDGRTWGPVIILRDDGGWRDLGYPRTIQRPDGKIVTLYYFNDHPKTERYVAATIWDAGKVGE